MTNTHGRYQLVQTQDHHRMENRPIAIEATLDEYRELPHFAQHTRHGANGSVIPGSPTPRTLPLWHGVQLCRGLCLGSIGLAAAAGHVLVLVLWIAVPLVAVLRIYEWRLAR